MMPSRLTALGLLCLLVSVPADARWIAGHPASWARTGSHAARLVPRRGRRLSSVSARRHGGEHAGQSVSRHALTIATGAQQPPACDGLSGRTLALDTSKPVHLGLETYPETLDLHDHEVVLTFDDGPSAATTPAVLDALHHECVKATFFLIGRNAATNPGLVKRELADGHTVGHHSMTHPSVTLRGLDERSGEANIDDGIAADEKAAYDDASRSGPRVPFFRFPGFADTKPLLDHLDDRHIAVFGTDLWAADWLPMTPDFERRRVIDLLERSPRHAGIILFHDTKASTARMLPAFLSDLRTKGYKVVDLVPAGAGGEPATVIAAPKGWSSETETIIAHLWPSIAPGTRRRSGHRRGTPSRFAEQSRGHRRALTALRSGSRRT